MDCMFERVVLERVDSQRLEMMAPEQTVVELQRYMGVHR